MTRERAKSMDQSSFWTVDAAGAPGKPHRPLMASPEPGRLLAFAPFLGFIWRMSAGTGYKGQDHLVGDLFGKEIAQKIGPVWGFDARSQELNNMWVPTAQPGLWFTGGSFAQCRMYSKYLALQIKAQDVGLGAMGG